jgi:GTPase SAR1 family protein
MPLKKIILIGPPEAGKTSIRRFFFEGIPAPELLEKPEAASVGFKYNNYEYLFSYPIEKEGIIPEKFPIQLSLVDTAGQELEKWLTIMKERVFGETDIILFVFDISNWFIFNKKKEINILLKRVE